MNHAQSRARNEHIAKLGSEGWSVERLSAAYGLTPNYIYVLFRKHGVDRRAAPTGAAGLTAKKSAILKRRAVMAELHSLGVSGGEAIRLMAMKKPVFYSEARKLGLKFRYDSSRWEAGGRSSQKRAAQMAELYRAGCTLQQIGDQFGISRERVRQLMTKHLGIGANDGGARVIADRTAEIRKQKIDQRSWAKHGCSYADYRSLVNLRKPTRAYASQKRNAISRGIGWQLNLWQWWTIWQQSGKWEQRGRAGDAFVMCRRNDQGPYSPDNVYIATLRHNSTVQPNNPYRKDHPDHQKVIWNLRKGRGRKIGQGGRHSVHTGLPAGVTKQKKTGKFAAQIRIAGEAKWLGTFDTAEAAHEAYMRAAQQVNTAHKISEEAA